MIVSFFAFDFQSLNNTKHPNTYTLSKALAEDIVYSYRTKFPIVIIRPSSVWYAMEEPFKGFIEGMHSGIAIICGGMTGFIRSMYVGKNSAAKITPVDYIISATIASAWKRSTVLTEDLLIYNCTDAEENPLPWNKSFETAKPYFLQYPPLEKMIWYPKISFTSSLMYHKFSMFAFQIMPAICYDALRMLSGKKPM